MSRKIVFIITGLLLFGISLSTVQSSTSAERKLTGVTPHTLPLRVELKWSFATEGEIKSSPAVKGNRVVVGSTDGFVYCLDLQGRLIWKYETDNAIEATALIHNNTVYIGNLTGMFYALDLKSGDLLWTYEARNQISGRASWWSDGNRKYILVGSYDFYLHCIDAQTGRGVWKYESDNYLHSAVAVIDNIAVFGGCDGFLHVVDISRGTAVRTIELASYIAGSAALDNGSAYIGDYDGTFSRVDYNTGRILWQFKVPERELPFLASPSVAGNRIVIGNRDRNVYCLNKTNGEIIWKRNTGSRVDASTVADTKNVLVANRRGDLMLLSFVNGFVIWNYELGTPIINTPAVADNLIIVGGHDGNIYALGRP